MWWLHCVSSDAAPDRRKGLAADDTQSKEPPHTKAQGAHMKTSDGVWWLHCVSSDAAPDRRKGLAADDTQSKEPPHAKAQGGALVSGSR